MEQGLIKKREIRTMSDNQFMHIKMEYDDAMSLKREILFSEVHFIKMLQKLQRFSELRAKEAFLREALIQFLHEMRSDITFFEKRLPKLKEKPTPEKKAVQKEKQKLHKKRYDSALEIQLEEIKQKLDSLHL